MHVYLEKVYNSIHFTHYNLVFKSLCQTTNKWFVLVPTELNKSHNIKSGNKTEIISNLCLTFAPSKPLHGRFGYYKSKEIEPQTFHSNLYEDSD